MSLSIPWINFKKKLRTNECYGEQININKKFRGIGLASTLRLKVFEELRKRGITKFYVGIPIWNKISRKSVINFGFTYITDISYLRVITCEGLRLKRSK